MAKRANREMARRSSFGDFRCLAPFRMSGRKYRADCSFISRMVLSFLYPEVTHRCAVWGYSVFGNPRKTRLPLVSRRMSRTMVVVALYVSPYDPSVREHHGPTVGAISSDLRAKAVGRFPCHSGVRREWRHSPRPKSMGGRMAMRRLFAIYPISSGVPSIALGHCVCRGIYRANGGFDFEVRQGVFFFASGVYLFCVVFRIDLLVPDPVDFSRPSVCRCLSPLGCIPPPLRRFVFRRSSVYFPNVLFRHQRAPSRPSALAIVFAARRRSRCYRLSTFPGPKFPTSWCSSSYLSICYEEDGDLCQIF